MWHREAHFFWLGLGMMACGDAGSAVSDGLDAGHDASTFEDARVAEDAAQPIDAGRPDPGVSDAGAEDAAQTLDASVEADAGAEPAATYAEAVTSFQPGAHAGFGQEKLPDVVLGSPVGGGNGAGSLDVLSLGVGGSIVLDMGEAGIVDGEGPDFIVFENAFWPGGDARRVFAELGEVSVSNDGSTWHVFPCDTAGIGAGRYPGCAGWTPTLAYDRRMAPLDPAATGGDAFDLATLMQTSARYVRIRDLSSTGAGTTAGFDLDAIGIVRLPP